MYEKLSGDLRVFMCDALDKAVMCPMCLRVFLGDVTCKKTFASKFKWYVLKEGEQVDTLPGVIECPHNKSWVKIKRGTAWAANP